jgi:hypothetical protein
MFAHQNRETRSFSLALFNSQRGSVIFAMIMVAMMAVITTLFLHERLMRSSLSKAHQDLLGISLKAQILTLKSTIGASDISKYTRDAPENATLKSCLTDPLFDCPPGDHEIVVKNVAAVVLFDSRATSTQGLNLKGESCNTFDANLGNDLCPLRLKMTWTASNCPPTAVPCYGNQVLVKTSLEFKPATNISLTINPANYEYWEYFAN